jgi:hypothetical protein
LKAFNILTTFAFALAKFPATSVSIPSDFTVSSVSVSAAPGYFVLGFDGSISLPPVRKRIKMPWKTSSKNSTKAFSTKDALLSGGSQLCGDGTSISCDSGFF